MMTDQPQVSNRDMAQNEQDDFGHEDDVANQVPVVQPATEEPVQHTADPVDDDNADDQVQPDGDQDSMAEEVEKDEDVISVVDNVDGASAEKQDEDGLVRTETIPAIKRLARQESMISHAFTSHRLHRFALYETNARYFITGADITDKYFKVLKIDRTSSPGHLNLFEDDIVYSKQEVNQLLQAIDEGNKATGGLRHKFAFWGLLGFIRFTETYYMLLITKRQQVAMLGGHYIYQVEGTELVPLTTGPSNRFSQNRNPEENRFLGILNNLDLNKNFYYSYTYNITRTLQENIIRERIAAAEGQHKPIRDHNDMFVWNHHLLSPTIHSLSNMYDWCVPIVHGFIDQSAINVFGRMIYVTIIGRRSRFFAGARFLKRGTNDLGYVANDVETEQIVSEMLTTSFHAPGPRLFSNPNYTSYVHHRGSIPLYWTQDNAGVSPKPDIDLNLTDPFYQPAALHFDNLFHRYGCPIYVLNLIKARERTPRESKLLHEFKNAVEYLNQFLPDEKKIQYKAFDMSRASKTRGGDVIGTLEKIAAEILEKTDFFVNGDTMDDIPHVQNGIARTNCIDCLDRTNAAQFVIGKHAFGLQLQALGVIPSPDMEYDSDAIDIFTHMFHNHGDTIAVQYGGSHLVNTMATYRKMNHWQGHGRDMVESFKRYYHNSFLDSQRQEAYNLFLGNYIYAQGQPMLWDLSTDYYLHHSDPRRHLDRSRSRNSYIDWFNPAALSARHLPPPPDPSVLDTKKFGLTDYDDFWLEYYRPLILSSFLKVYAFRLSASNRFLTARDTKPTPDPSNPSANPYSNSSPFVPRPDPSRPSHPPESPDKRSRKGVTIVDPNSEPDEKRAAKHGHHSPQHNQQAGASILLHPATPLTPNLGASGMLSSTTTLPTVISGSGGRDHDNLTGGDSPDQPRYTSNGISNSGGGGATSTATTTAGSAKTEFDKSLMNQWTLNRIYENSLNPSVSAAEAAEYDRYVAHPSTIPLVVSDDVEDSEVAVEYADYVASGSVGAVAYGWEDTDGGVGNATVGGAVGSFGIVGREAMRVVSAASAASWGSGLGVSWGSVGGPGAGGGGAGQGGGPWDVTDEDVGEFRDFVDMARREDPLTVFDQDRDKKRYKAYRQWLVKGKSLFKQSKVDPEYRI